MKILIRLISMLALIALTACGGGNSGTSPFGAPNGGGSGGVAATPTPTAIEVIASSQTVSSGGSEITISALVKGAGNATIASAPVSFSASSGTVLAPVSQTNASGVAAVRFTSGADRSNRTARVTVTSGTVSGSVDIQITGTRLQVVGPQNLSVGQAADLRVSVFDGTGQPIRGVSVTARSPLGNGLSATTATTDAVGTATLRYTANTAGADVVEFTGGGETSTLTIEVKREENLAFVIPGINSRTIPLNTDADFQVQYLLNGLPASGNFRVRFAATSGVVSPANAGSGISLDGNGQALVQLRSSFAGPAMMQATLLDGTTGAVVAQAVVQVQFVARVARSIVLQVTPKAIGPNSAGNTTSRAQLRATVTDANGNPVQGATVNFSKLADPSGGTLSDASAVTDAVGQASVQFIAGQTSTASDAVVLTATVADNIAVTGQATFTVNQSALFIALGTGNEISNFNLTTYEKVWTVYVTDSSGAAIPNQLVTVSVLPTRYRKGSFVLNAADDYVYFPWPGGVDLEGNMLPGSFFTCQNEDDNYDGVITTGKDRNINGRLDPGNVITVNGGANLTTVTTDANGFALLRLRYAESYAAWVEVALKASATVGGTESNNEVLFFVPGVRSDYTKGGGPPAGLLSPFGQRPDCTDRF